MKYGLIFVLLGTVALTCGCKPNAPKWRRATRAECLVEEKREVAEMIAAGMCCDPPMQMGSAYFTGFLTGETIGHGTTPCGRIDGKGDIHPVWWVMAGGRQCELSREEYDALYVNTKKLVNGKPYESNEFSEALFQAALTACRSGKLPLLEDRSK